MSDPTVAPSPSGSPSQGRPSAWRRTYVVDGRTQFRVAGLLIAGLAILGVIQAVSLYVFFQPPSDGRFDGDQVRALMLEVGMVQFAVTALLALALGVLLSHRFVGAGLVLRRAVQGMAVGDSSQRLTLRKTDFLHDLSADILKLRELLDKDRAAMTRALGRVEEALVAGDPVKAQAALALAQHTLVPASLASCAAEARTSSRETAKLAAAS